MKKFLCILFSLMLLAGSMALSEQAADTQYDMLLVTDIFTTTDSETEESGAATLVIQGAFGKIGDTVAAGDDAAESEAETEMLGFDKEDIYSLTLAEGCEILLPVDLTNPTENVKITDLQAWYDKANIEMAEYFADDQGSYEFYANIELNEEGELTKLEYQYFDWQ